MFQFRPFSGTFPTISNIEKYYTQNLLDSEEMRRPFESENQRKKVMSILNPNNSNITRSESRKNFDKTQRILNALAWSGCIAVSDYCTIIKGVNRLYELYKNSNKFRNYLELDVKLIFSEVNNELINNQIDAFSDKIVEITEKSDLLHLISEETNIDENTIRNIIKGTASNVLLQPF